MALIDNASLLMVPSVYEDGTLYNVLPSGNKAPDETGNHNGYDQTRADFTFSRGSNLAATRVNADGLIEKGRENLYTQSNNFNHSDWTPKAGTFASGVTDPNGGTDAWSWTATNTDPYLYQSKNFTGVHTLSIYVKGVGGTIGDDFQIRVGNALKDVTLTGDWQRVEHFGVLSGSINIGFEYGNPATAGDIVHIYAAQLEVGTIATDYIDSGATTAKAGILEDMPRINYDANGQNGALLMEPSRANLVTQSEYIGSWTKNNSSVTDNDSISPQGVQNASAIVGDGSTNYHWIQRDSGSGTSGTTYTTSFFAKKGSVNFVQLVLDSPVFGVMHQNFDLENGTIGSGSGSTTPFIENYSNGWYRVGVTATATGTATIKPLIALANSNTMGRFASFATSGDIKIFGVQVEAGSYVSSYIPCHGSSTTRSGDNYLLNNMVANGITNDIGISFFIDAEAAVDTVNTYIDLFALKLSNGENLRIESRTNDRFYVQCSSGFVNSGDSPNSYNTASFAPSAGRAKILFTMTPTQLKLYYNGSLLETWDGSYNIDFNQFRSDVSQATTQLKNNVKQSLILTSAISNQEAIDLTTL